MLLHVLDRVRDIAVNLGTLLVLLATLSYVAMLVEGHGKAEFGFIWHGRLFVFQLF